LERRCRHSCGGSTRRSPTAGSGRAAGCWRGGGRRGVWADARRHELPRGRTWPDGLLPVVERDPGYYCVDCTSPEGRVVDWDPEELGEFRGEKAFAASFSEEAPSVEAWLESWVGGKTQAEQHAEMMQSAMAKAQAQTQAYWRT
jgi:hypothetical protein